MRRSVSLRIMLAAALASATVGVVQAHASPVAGKPGYQWSNVAIGGGGYVTGMAAHPAERDLVYIRTDVGGAYRWNPQGESWTPITDWIKTDDRDLYRIESLAIAPTDTGTIYLAGGDGAPASSAIMKSTDRGNTFTVNRLGIAISGNPGGETDDPARSSGERLAVDPGTANVVYYGSRNDGLWRSTNAGATWARDTRFPVTGAPGRGLAFVLFGQTGDTIYVAVYGDGIYRTTNAGAAWTRLAGSPDKPNRAAIASTGDLYVTHKSGVAKLSGDTWTDVTPGTDLFARDGKTSGVQHAWRTTADGYEIELAIPWANLGLTPAAGMAMGFDLGNNDDDDGGDRNGQSIAFGDGDNWQNTSNFGGLTLLEDATPPAAGIGAPRVSGGEIVVDGSIDEGKWLQGGTTLPHRADDPDEGQVLWSWPGPWDNTVTYSALWNDTYLYVAARVLDDSLFNDSDAAYQDDSIEVYIDGDQDGGPYDSHDNQYVKGWNRETPPYNAISVDPAAPAHVMAVEANRGFSNPIYESFDGGQTWAQVEYTRNNTVPWWPEWHWSASTASLTIDPHRPGRVWYTDWYGVWRTDDVTAVPSTWTNFEKGHEEAVVVSNITSPPSGDVLLHSGVADNGGYDHTSLTAFPTESHRDRGLPDTTTTGVDFSEVNPNFLVRVGRQYNSGNNARGGYSTDGGKTYTPFPSLPEAGGRVAVSATSERIVWAAQGLGDGKVRYTTDRGTTWNLSTGAPGGTIPTDANWVGCQPLASDRAAADTFYMYQAGKLYRSTDGGATFADTGATGLPSMPCGYFEDFTVKAAPGIAGEVWINFGASGLYRSTDAGDSFKKVDGVATARAFGFGIGPDTSTPSLYLHGIVNGTDGIFRSDNLAGSWTKINATETIGCRIKDLTGDRQVFGRVYIATDGRGIYYAEMKNEPSPPTGSLPVTGTQVIVIAGIGVSALVLGVLLFVAARRRRLTAKH